MEKRLARGDKGINGLDDACKEHDISYAKNTDLESRHAADKILGKNAWARFKAKDASWKEKLAALGVAGAMKAKVKLGMGFDNKENIMNDCVKSMEKVKKSTEKSLENINTCLEQFQKTKKKQSKTKKVIKRNTNVTNSGVANLDTISHVNTQQQQQQPHDKIESNYKHNNNNISNKNVKLFRKRKLDVENYAPLEKSRKTSMDVVKRKKLKKTTAKKVMSTMMMMKGKKRKLDVDGVEPLKKLRKIGSFRKRKLNIEDGDDDDGSLRKVRKLKDTRRKRKLGIESGVGNDDPLKKIRKLLDTKPLRKRKLNNGDKDDDDDDLGPIEKMSKLNHYKPLPLHRKRKHTNGEDNFAEKIPKLAHYEPLPLHRKRKYINDSKANLQIQPVTKKPKII